MKGFIALVLVGGLAAFLLGYGPQDLMNFCPSFGSSNPPPKVRRVEAATAEQAPSAAPAPARNGRNAATTSDGSLDQRWKSDPGSSPAKP